MKNSRNNLVLDFHLKGLRKTISQHHFICPKRRWELFIPGSEPGRIHTCIKPYTQQETPPGCTARLFA